MAKKNLLLVDADSKSLRMLEVSLRKSGFSVTTAISASDARDKVKLSQPDLIITDTKLPGDENGFELVANLKSTAETSSIPIIFLSSENKLEQKVTGLELGVEDYLTKPIYIREVLTRVRVLLEKREKAQLERRERSATFAGSLGEMGLVDLMQTVEIGRKTGRLFIESRNQKGSISFREGKVADARCSRLSGERAFYRMLVWNDGVFSMEFGAHDEPDVIELSTQGLLMEGMRRVDEWGRLLEQLPPLDRAFEIDYGELVERLAEIPDEINGILRLFDGRRTLLDVVDESDFGDLEALEIASKLFFEGLIFDVTDRPADESEPAPQQVAKIEAWLEGGEDGADIDDGAMLENTRLEPTLPPTMLEDDHAVSAPPAILSTLPSPASARASTVPRLAELTPDGEIVPGSSAQQSNASTPPMAAASLPSVPPPRTFSQISRVPGFMTTTQPTPTPMPPRTATPMPTPQAPPRPLPTPEAEVPEPRAVAPRAAVNATAWSSLPKAGGDEDGWEDVVAPSDGVNEDGDDLGLSDDQGKGPRVELGSHEPDLAGQVAAALPPELASEGGSSFEDEPRNLAQTPTPSRAPDTIADEPALRASTSAPPTIINPVQAGAPTQADVPTMVPGDAKPDAGGLANVVELPRRPSSSALPAVGLSAASDIEDELFHQAIETTPIDRRPPRPPPATDLGIGSMPEPSVALSPPATSPASSAPPKPAAGAAEGEPATAQIARDLGERIHTVRTAVDIPRPPRQGPSPAMLAAGVVTIIGGVLFGIFLAGQFRDDRPAQGGALGDAGSLLAAPPDAGSQPITSATLPPIVDAGAQPSATVDAGSAVVVAASADAGPSSDDPDAPFVARMKAADAASKRGEFVKAIREYKAALALKPTSVAVHLGLGNAYYELDSNDTALMHIEKARALAPRDPQVYVLLGAVYQTLGRKDDAIGAYQRYLALAPTGKFARDVKGILKGLGAP